MNPRLSNTNHPEAGRVGNEVRGLPISVFTQIEAGCTVRTPQI